MASTDTTVCICSVLGPTSLALSGAVPFAADCHVRYLYPMPFRRYLETRPSGGRTRQALEETGCGSRRGLCLKTRRSNRRHDSVVAVCSAQMALVVMIPSTLGHGGIYHLFVNLCLGLLLLWQRLHQFEAELFFHLQNASSLVWARINLIGFGAREPGRHDQLRTVEEYVEAQVVAVEADAPWARGRRLAEQHKVITPSGDNVSRRIARMLSRTCGVTLSSRTPLSLRRNSGFDHVRHSGESMCEVGSDRVDIGDIRFHDGDGLPWCAQVGGPIHRVYVTAGVCDGSSCTFAGV
ncbi:hypothetical protein KCU88_g68, partial [Aureobasidium melanogenum]